MSQTDQPIQPTSEEVSFSQIHLALKDSDEIYGWAMEYFFRRDGDRTRWMRKDQEIMCAALTYAEDKMENTYKATIRIVRERAAAQKIRRQLEDYLFREKE